MEFFTINGDVFFRHDYYLERLQTDIQYWSKQNLSLLLLVINEKGQALADPPFLLTPHEGGKLALHQINAERAAIYKLKRYDVFCLRTFRARGNCELDFLAFVQGFES